MSDKRLRELILYIAEKSKDDPHFGAIKLNKILFLADFNYYAWRGKSLTGSKYVHRGRGPVPYRMPVALDTLQKDKRAEIQELEYHGYTQKRVVPLKGADTSMFTEEELSLVDSVIEQTWGANATDISEWTHKLKPWKVTEDSEEIPYHSIYFLQDYPVERAGLNWAIKEIERLKKEHGYAP